METPEINTKKGGLFAVVDPEAEPSDQDWVVAERDGSYVTELYTGQAHIGVIKGLTFRALEDADAA